MASRYVRAVWLALAATSACAGRARVQVVPTVDTASNVGVFVRLELGGAFLTPLFVSAGVTIDSDRSLPLTTSADVVLLPRDTPRLIPSAGFALELLGPEGTHLFAHGALTYPVSISVDDGGDDRNDRDDGAWAVGASAHVGSSVADDGETIVGLGLVSEWLAWGEWW
jgi:hypothetical protein